MFDRDQQWDRNWRRLEAMARRGFRGLSEFASADWSAGLGDNFRIGRMLASGDLRLVALFLIEQQPRHGYDLIKAIEERSGGFYSPSPGIVYPALTYLEEAGYATSAADGNRKVYTITEAGLSHLAENREAIDSTLGFLRKAGEQMHKWRQAATEGARPFTGGSPEETAWAGARNDRPGTPAAAEFETVRRELKDEIRRVRRAGEGEQRRVATILERTLAEIRHGAGTSDPHGKPD